MAARIRTRSCALSNNRLSESHEAAERISTGEATGLRVPGPLGRRRTNTRKGAGIGAGPSVPDRSDLDLVSEHAGVSEERAGPSEPDAAGTNLLTVRIGSHSIFNSVAQIKGSERAVEKSDTAPSKPSSSTTRQSESKKFDRLSIFSDGVLGDARKLCEPSYYRAR